MISYPTPDNAANIEWMSGNFLKLHPGAPVHYFRECSDPEYHTHPFPFTTHIVEGGYIEEVLLPNMNGGWDIETFERHPGTSHHMPLGIPHKLIKLLNGPCITRCEYGPSTHTPGFCRFGGDGILLHRYHNESEWKPYNPNY